MREYGEYLEMRIFVTPENLDKLDLILQKVNSSPEIMCGEIPLWTKQTLYEELFNAAIAKYKL